VSLRNSLSSIWKDPVWSKVIAGSIFAVFTLLLVQLRRLIFSGPSISVILWGGLLVGLAAAALLLLFVWHHGRHKRRTLVFLSAGGTCRDPMAKVIMTKLLKDKNLKHEIDIYAAGLGPLTGTRASYAARYAIKEMYGEDLLTDHRPVLLTPELIQKADLILAMDNKLLTTPGKTLPRDKTFLIKEFFGDRGDIEDPWPDGKDTATISRYRYCAADLERLFTANLDRLVRVLDL